MHESPVFNCLRQPSTVPDRNSTAAAPEPRDLPLFRVLKDSAMTLTVIAFAQTSRDLEYAELASSAVVSVLLHASESTFSGKSASTLPGARKRQGSDSTASPQPSLAQASRGPKRQKTDECGAFGVNGLPGTRAQQMRPGPVPGLDNQLRCIRRNLIHYTPAFLPCASRLIRSLALMVSNRSAVARSWKWSVAQSSITLPYVSRIEQQRHELFTALPIGGAVSSGVITLLEEGRVELEELATCYCVCPRPRSCSLFAAALLEVDRSIAGRELVVLYSQSASSLPRPSSL
jgi:hypothetical protein